MNRSRAKRLMDKRNWTDHLTDRLGPDAQVFIVNARSVPALRGRGTAYIAQMTMPN